MNDKYGISSHHHDELHQRTPMEEFGDGEREVWGREKLDL